jgi:hypothetical protein
METTLSRSVPALTNHRTSGLAVCVGADEGIGGPGTD